MARVAAGLVRRAALAEGDLEILLEILGDGDSPSHVAPRLAELLEAGATAEELAAVHALRAAWRPFHTEAPSPILSWSYGLRILRAFQGYPDIDELVEVVDRVSAELLATTPHLTRAQQLRSLASRLVRAFEDTPGDAHHGTAAGMETFLGAVAEDRGRRGLEWLQAQGLNPIGGLSPEEGAYSYCW